MRSINVVFDDEEFKKLESVKGEKSWHDFFMGMVGVK